MKKGSTLATAKTTIATFFYKSIVTEKYLAKQFVFFEKGCIFAFRFAGVYSCELGSPKNNLKFY